MPTYYRIYSRFVDTTVIKSAVILTSLRLGIVSTSWRLRSWVGSNASCWEVWTWHEPWAKNALWETDGYGDLLSKSAVSLDVMREGFSAAKALPRQAGNGYDWLIGAVVIVTKLSYVVVRCMDYVSDDHSITPYSGHIHWTVLLPFHREPSYYHSIFKWHVNYSGGN